MIQIQIHNNGLISSLVIAVIDVCRSISTVIFPSETPRLISSGNSKQLITKVPHTLAMQYTQMILNTDSQDVDDHNCFKIIFVSSFVLVLHLSGVILVKRLSSLSQLYLQRARHTYEWHFLRIDNVYLSNLKISIC